jgi:hypothetical protein
MKNLEEKKVYFKEKTVFPMMLIPEKILIS